MSRDFTSPGAGNANAEERFRVASRLEIVGYLRQIAERHEQVGVEFGQRDFIVTALLDVDSQAGRIVCDYGADANAMNRLLRASSLRLATQLDHVGVRFESGPAAPASLDGAPAFVIELPSSILRIQRREGYRLRVPLGRPLRCEIADPQSPGKRLAVRVRDISVCGMSLVDLPVHWRVASGTIYRECTVVLPDGLGTLRVDLEVMHAPQSAGARCGCRFISPGQATATRIQRYITRIERDLHARQ
jgi:flagellar brake protein